MSTLKKRTKRATLKTDMRKLALFLSLTLIAAALHFGAMAGFQVMTELATSHAAHAGHEMPLLPTCPIGSICPMASNPLLNLNAAVLLLLSVFVAVFFASICLPSLAVLPLAYAGPPGFRPNNANSLLSVFKRE